MGTIGVAGMLLRKHRLHAHGQAHISQDFELACHKCLHGIKFGRWKPHASRPPQLSRSWSD